MRGAAGGRLRHPAGPRPGTRCGRRLCRMAGSAVKDERRPGPPGAEVGRARQSVHFVLVRGDPRVRRIRLPRRLGGQLARRLRRRAAGRGARPADRLRLRAGRADLRRREGGPGPGGDRRRAPPDRAVRDRRRQHPDRPGAGRADDRPRLRDQPLRLPRLHDRYRPAEPEEQRLADPPDHALDRQRRRRGPRQRGHPGGRHPVRRRLARRRSASLRSGRQAVRHGRRRRAVRLPRFARAARARPERAGRQGPPPESRRHCTGR